MHMVTMVLVGLLIGAAARLLLPGRPGGVLVTTLVGLAGSLLAGFFGRSLGWYQGPYSGLGIAASIVGAMIVLWFFGLTVQRRHDRTR